MIKNILILDANNVIANGGVEVLERHIAYAEELHKLSNGNCRLLICGGEKLQENLLRVTRIHNRHLCLLVINNSGIKRFFSWYKASKKIRLLDMQIDLIVAGDPWISGVNALILRYRNYVKPKVQIQLHADIFAKGWKFISIQHFVKYIIARFVISRANFIRTVSRNQTINVAPFLRNDQLADCIPVSLSIAKLSLVRTNREYLTFGFLGRLHKDRGTEFLIEKFKNILAKYQDIQLVIAGAGPEEANLRKYLLDRFPNRVHILGQISRSQQVDFWQSIDVLVSFAEYESYGRAVRESIAMKVPVIALKSSGILDLVESELCDWVSIIEWNISPEEFVRNAENLHQKVKELKDPNLEFLSLDTSTLLAKSWIDVVMSK